VEAFSAGIDAEEGGNGVDRDGDDDEL